MTRARSPRLPLAGHTLLEERPEGSLIYAPRPRNEVCIRRLYKVLRMGRGERSTLRIFDLLRDPGESTPIGFALSGTWARSGCGGAAASRTLEWELSRREDA